MSCPLRRSQAPDATHARKWAGAEFVCFSEDGAWAPGWKRVSPIVPGFERSPHLLAEIGEFSSSEFKQACYRFKDLKVTEAIALAGTGPAGGDGGARWTLVAAVATQAEMVLTASILSIFGPGGPIRGAAYRSPMRRRAQERA